MVQVRRGDATESSLSRKHRAATHRDEEWAGDRVEIITLLLLPCTNGSRENCGRRRLVGLAGSG
jgi:hypothetical protein